MAKSNRAYRSAKRGKELARQKKQEAKRLKRLEKEKEEAELAQGLVTSESPEETLESEEKTQSDDS